MRHCTKLSIRIPPTKKFVSAHSALTRFLTKPSWPLSLFQSCFQLRFLCRDPPLCVIDHLQQYPFRLSRCVLGQSAIWYRAWIHLNPASPSVVRDLTMASSTAGRLSIDEAAPSLWIALHRLLQSVTNNVGCSFKPPQ